MTELILTHDQADFDAVASLLAAHKLYPAAVPVLPPRLNRNVAEFVALYQNGLPFVHDLPEAPYERLILVDTQRPSHKIDADIPYLIIDHHPRSPDLADNATFTGEVIGATVTLLIEQIRAQRLSINSLEATLMALGIYADTGAMTYGGTTPRDIEAAAWLLQRKAVLDTVRRFMASPLNDLQQDLLDELIDNAEARSVQGYTVIISLARQDEYVTQINSVTHHLTNMLDPDALFVLVKMPKAFQMVARSRTDAVDVGEIARDFGGGGHGRAAAAKIKGREPAETQAELWAMLEQTVQPVTRVADLMSYGVQTVRADVTISEIIHQLRRIGHEGYPVLDEGHVVGLLTRRDADRALEHGLGNARVRDVMVGGEITLIPDDSVSALEQLMVQSGWGQIPVVDSGGHIMGIVTRTDLIKHWVKVHPTVSPPDDHLDLERISEVLGTSVTRIVDVIAAHARQESASIYMVGGVVRDLLLNRPNYDIDFVVESDAIAFAEALCDELGGEVSSFRPFGTAKWQLDSAAAVNLGVELDNVPEYIDFATSRNEFYEHPTALPSVYNSSIKLDLHRRDFTINTLAVQLSPERAANRLLDFYGGLDDLRNGVIRVLHSLSFVDDPTRVLRAVRFEKRLGFRIEARTAELIETALTMLHRITGERVRNELTLILREAEPELALNALEERGILAAIHPALRYDPRVTPALIAARGPQAGWPVTPDDPIDLCWHLLMAYIPPEHVEQVGRRLLFSEKMISSFRDAAELAQHDDIDLPPSQITDQLENRSETALLAAWLLRNDTLHRQIEQYLTRWRHLRPTVDGNMLKSLGLPPGPRYRVILNRLRQAWLDGEISSEDEERHLLKALIEETA